MADMDADKLKELQTLGGTAIKPIGWDRTGWEAFSYMLWNPDTGEVLTRTPLSWLKITAFYCVYYTCLAGFWIACLNIFFQTLPETVDGPRWTQGDSIIGVNPGVGLRPRNQDALIDSQMFVLQDGDTNQLPSEPNGEGSLNADYAKRMENFLAVYSKTSMGANDNGDYPTFSPEATLGECGRFPYGYVEDGNSTVAPCIFVKLNSIWGWTPEAYVCTNEPSKVDDDMPMCPEGVDLPATAEPSVKIDCQGRYAADKEALEGSGLTYFPASKGLPIKYFPFEGKSKTEAYHSPLVAVKVSPAKKGQMVHIECRAYYAGVKHVTKSKEGLVQFEVQIKKD